jgi:predicted ATPase
MCEANLLRDIPANSRIITSDDVFDYMLEIRSLNEGVALRREEVREEYLDAKYARFQVKTMEDFERLRRVNKARRKTQTQFVKSEVIDSVRELSNGESAYKYFTEKIGENGLYILDEPENSLSPGRQMELKGFIEDSVRFFGCQFIISTHSPFLLATPQARVYDLDGAPAGVRRWTELENVRLYHDFFTARRDEFDGAGI